jgi:hypothetical protein
MTRKIRICLSQHAMILTLGIPAHPSDVGRKIGHAMLVRHRDDAELVKETVTL